MDLRDYIDVDEEIIWQGRPPRGIRLREIDIFLIPFSILWTSFAILWTIAASGMLASSEGAVEAPPILNLFTLFGLAFVSVGLFFTFGRFIVDAAIRRRTEYALTNHRAIIFSGLFSRSIDSMPLTKNLQVKVRGDKTGSIEFGPGRGLFDLSSGLSFWIGPLHPFVFHGIKDVRDVYRLVREIQNKDRY